MKKVKINFRRYIVFIIFCIFFFVLFLKITYLQLFHHDFFEKLAHSQHITVVPVEGERGNIFDREGRPLTVNLAAYSVYIDPYSIEDKQKAKDTLVGVLNIDERALTEKLNLDRRFVWIKRKTSLEGKELLQESKVQGVGFIREKKRVFPQGSLAAHVIGGVNVDNEGIEGIELLYDRYLRGKEGYMTSFKDSASRSLIFSPHILNPQRGADVFLTIDAQVQYWGESFLKETVEDFNARAGSIVILNAHTGEVLALGNYPSFDPNHLGTYSFEHRRNRVITDMFEPGSVFKIITLVSALAQGAFTEGDVIFCENGAYKIPGTILHDYRPHGKLTFMEVFKKSSNIGTTKIAHTLGKKVLYEYICKLGFGTKTQIDLPGEISGLVKPLHQWSNTSEYIVSIGQEIGVNLMQLAQAMCIIANGGYMIQPHVVKKIVHEKFFREPAYVKKRIIPFEVCERAQNILYQVVTDGTGKYARIEGVKAGGKTGTAQKFDVSMGRYSHTKYRASFVGFIHKDSLSLVIAVSIDEPKKSHLGGVVAAPLFKRIGREVVRYLENKQLEKLIASGF